MTKISHASSLNVLIFWFLSSSVTVNGTSCVGSWRSDEGGVVLRIQNGREDEKKGDKEKGVEFKKGIINDLSPVTSPSSARLRQLGGVRAPAGEAQRRPRLPPQVPLRKLPSLHRGRPGPAGALVPRITRGGLHAPAGVQGKHLDLHLSQKVIHGAQDFRELRKKDIYTVTVPSCGGVEPLFVFHLS